MSCASPAIYHVATLLANAPGMRDDGDGTVLEWHLDRRWFFTEPWKTALAAAVELVRRVRSRRRIVVPPMSEAWLTQHAVDYPKHTNDHL